MKSGERKRVWPHTYADFAREACRGNSWVLLKLTGSIVIDNECWTAFRTLCGQLNGFDISFCYCSAASNGTAFRDAPGATGRVIYLRLVRFVAAQQRCCMAADHSALTRRRFVVALTLAQVKEAVDRVCQLFLSRCFYSYTFGLTSVRNVLYLKVGSTRCLDN